MFRHQECTTLSTVRIQPLEDTSHMCGMQWVKVDMQHCWAEGLVSSGPDTRRLNIECLDF